MGRWHQGSQSITSVAKCFCWNKSLFSNILLWYARRGARCGGTSYTFNSTTPGTEARGLLHTAVICIARPCIKTTTTAAMMGVGHGNHHNHHNHHIREYIVICMYICFYIHRYLWHHRSQICISVHFIYVYLVIQYIRVCVIYVNAHLYIKCMNQNMDLNPPRAIFATRVTCAKHSFSEPVFLYLHNVTVQPRVSVVRHMWS